MGAVSSEWACLWANRPQTFSANEECSEESRSGVLRVGRKWGLVCAQWAPWWLRAGRGWTVETSTPAGRGGLGAEGRVQRLLPGVARHTAAASTRLYILDTDWWTRFVVDTAHGGHGLWPQGGRVGSTGVDCGASGHHHRCGDKWAGCLPGPRVASRGRASRRAQRVAGLPCAASVWASARGRRSRELSRSSLRLRPRAEMRTRPAQPRRALPGSRCPGRRPPAPAERSGQLSACDRPCRTDERTLRTACPQPVPCRAEAPAPMLATGPGGLPGEPASPHLALQR